MKALTTVLTFSAFLAMQAPALAKEQGITPYDHMPVDTFIAGFPLESLVLLGLFAYALGVLYIFSAVHLKNKK